MDEVNKIIEEQFVKFKREVSYLLGKSTNILEFIVYLKFNPIKDVNMNSILETEKILDEINKKLTEMENLLV